MVYYTGELKSNLTVHLVQFLLNYLKYLLTVLTLNLHRKYNAN